MPSSTGGTLARGGDGFGRRDRSAAAGGQHAAEQHQRQAQRDAEGERLAEQQYPEDDGDGRVDERDDQRPLRPHLADEQEEHREGERRADDAERGYGEQRLRRGV